MKGTAIALLAGLAALTSRAQHGPELSLTLIPPSPVTDQSTLDIRGAVWNRTDAARKYEMTVFLDERNIHRETVEAAPRSPAGIKFRLPAKGLAGKHKVTLVAQTAGPTLKFERPIEILASNVRSTRRLGGAWVDIYHHDPVWGRPFMEELGRLNDAQWRELVRAMHESDQDLLVITMMFQNFTHRGRHRIPAEGYHGKAYYPSRLFPNRMPIATEDPLETILDEADKLGMHVMPGVGMYAFFDYTPDSLDWHKKVADELWERYGRHPSFYGWYISEEGGGGLDHFDELLAFCREFTAHVRRLAPDKPVMMARNSYNLRGTQGAYRQLTPFLDILGAFCFHRLPRVGASNMTGEEAAALLQSACDETGCHLWMDLESFTMTDQRLLPRPVEGLIADLTRFTTFEKVLHYQFPGMLSSPRMSRQPGGPAAVQLYTDYLKYLEEGPLPNLAQGKPVALATAYAAEYPGGGTNALTDGISASEDTSHAAWQGYHGTNLDAVIDLGKSLPLRRVYASFLQDRSRGVYLPTKVEYAVSEDGAAFRVAQEVTLRPPDVGGPLPRTCRAELEGLAARYVRVRATNVGAIPPGMPGAGKPAWLFVDEVIALEK